MVIRFNEMVFESIFCFFILLHLQITEKIILKELIYEIFFFLSKSYFEDRKDRQWES